MLAKIVWAIAASAALTGLVVLWLFASESARTGQRQKHDTEAVKQCCLKDIRTTQEALTKLSMEAQKLRARLTASLKGTAPTPLVSSIQIIEEQARSAWDQLEALIEGGAKRRQLRDLRITFEGLKENFAIAETCCGTNIQGLPSAKSHFQTAEGRFQAIQAKLVPSYIEQEISPAHIAHESGYSYVVQQNFDGAGDSIQNPNGSALRLYENGVELGPAHSPHAEIRQYGGGRFSHWGDTLYFSTSDNSNPLSNNRRYTYKVYNPAAVDD